MEFLLPMFIFFTVLLVGFFIFKKFLKIIIVLALVSGFIAFYTQDVFAGSISDCLTGGGCSSSDESKKGSVYVMIQNEEGKVLIFERPKKPVLMTITEDNKVLLFDRKVRKFDIGELKDPTIKKMIKEFFGDPELFNVIEEEEDK